MSLTAKQGKNNLCFRAGNKLADNCKKNTRTSFITAPNVSFAALKESILLRRLAFLLILFAKRLLISQINLIIQFIQRIKLKRWTALLWLKYDFCRAHKVFP